MVAAGKQRAGVRPVHRRVSLTRTLSRLRARVCGDEFPFPFLGVFVCVQTWRTGRLFKYPDWEEYELFDSDDLWSESRHAFSLARWPVI